MKRSSAAWMAFVATRLAGVLVDVAIIAVSYFAAFALRFDFCEPSWGYGKVALCLVAVSAAYVFFFLVTGCYRLSWRRISVIDIPRYFLACVLASGFLTALRFLTPVDTFAHIRPPYSITVISFFLILTGTVAVRRMWAIYCRAGRKEENLLSREVKHFDNSASARFLLGRTVMVTGAGGSIGSEIVKQAIELGVKTVIMVERSENALYEIDRFVREIASENSAVPVLKDILDKDSLGEVFAKYRPSVVLHAAAYKHVPMLEQNKEEAWRNNLEGTENVAELSLQYGVERFVLISTDKAVNPVSVMGKTKKAAEDALMRLNSLGKTSFAAVRFGNVLGSSGSVVPLFKDLISRRRPLTVTHIDMRRYFMTVGEAVSLVLQAASRNESAIYTLDMGEPVRIIDLAEDMIKQAGFRPYVDIPIVFTGIRPGEKIFEELDVSERTMYKTDMAKIYITKTAAFAFVAFAAFASFADDTTRKEAFPPDEISMERYQPIIDRQIFGSPPENFDPTRSPADVASSRRSGTLSGQEVTKEQRELQKAVRFTALNIGPDRKVYVGFTDTSDPKLPKHFYLTVGQESRGWKVVQADAVAGTAELEKDGIEISLVLGGESTSRLKTASEPSSGRGLNSLRERRRLREMRILEGERMAAANNERISQERAAIAQELLNLKDTLETLRQSQESRSGNADNGNHEAH